MTERNDDILTGGTPGVNDQGSLELTPDGGMALDNGRVQFEPHDRTERGPYSGKSPRGVYPTDDQVGSQVYALMTDNDWIDPSDIDVHVANGEVTLTGSVEDSASSRLAENIARAVSLVRAVQNQLQVRHPEG